MRRLKIYFLLAAFIGIFNHIDAQCPLTEGLNFTATDTYGNNHNLFDYLDNGKYVLIDFFFTN